MRDGVTLFTIVYAPVDTSRAVPILMTRSPYGSEPYGPDAYPPLARAGAGLREGRLHLRLPGRPRPLPLRRRVRRDAADADCAGADRRRREHRHLRHDRLAAEERPETQRARRPVGRVVRRLLRGRGAAARPPGAQGGVAAGADRRPVPRRRLVPQRRLHAGGELQLLHRILPAARRSARRKTTAPPFSYGTQDGYAFYLGLGGLQEGSARRFPPGNTYWEDNLAHPTYDAFWKARAIAPHLRDIAPAVLTVGGWYDAEDLAGPLAHLSRHRAAEPGDVEPARHGAVGARGLVAW